VDASILGRWFHVEALAQETRWPAFTPRARKLGINAILSTPLMVDDRPVGALNIYSRTTRAFEADDQELASVLATEASIILTDAGVDTSDDQLTRRFADALAAREVIAVAQGVIMERDGVSGNDAYASLRRSSVNNKQPLRAWAEQVGASPRPTPPPGRSAGATDGQIGDVLDRGRRDAGLPMASCSCATSSSGA